jgi:methyl-accepting chemotaxis protein
LSSGAPDADAGLADRAVDQIDLALERGSGCGFAQGRGRMAMLAMWFQGTDAVSEINTNLLTIFVGLVALAMLVQAIALIVLAVKSAKAIKGLVETVDELKQKALPLIDSATEISRSAQSLMTESAPKVHAIADNLLETSDLVRGTAQHFEETLADANLRTQRQVARVDGMVSAALTATVEIVEAVSDSIRGPVQIIAAMVGQAKLLAEGLLARIKSFANR